MSKVDPILLWLNRVPDPYTTQSHNYSVKRCQALPAPSETRPLKRRLLSPPPEEEDRESRRFCLKMEQPLTPSKRQRITDVGGDATYRLSPLSQSAGYEEGEEGDPTPRATGKTRKSSKSIHSGSTRSSNRSSRLSASTTSSYKVVGLSLQEEGVEVRQLAFGGDTMPSKLSAMVEKIVPWSRGKRVIASSVRETVDPALLRKWYVDTDLSFADESETLSSSLPWDSVENILLYAKECFERHHSEMVWNIEVHQRLMEQVFRKGKHPRLVDFISCHSATITPDYLPPGINTKLVDFCMFINPEADPDQTIDYVERIRRWRRVAPMHSINHTKCLGLAGQPVSTSFETKRTGNDMDNAVLQIGVWHSAQWNCLRHMLRTLWTPAEAEVALNELGVLPAIITQGHDWSFAATTLEEKRTVLWLNMSFGGTNSPTGIYAIATVLEYLRWWTGEVYWTWFKKYILDPQLP